MRYNELKLEIWKVDEFMLAPDEGILDCYHGPRHVAVDLGAHVGTRSLWLATDGAFEKVYAVEMEIENYMLLCRNVERNGMVGKIIPILAAVSDRHELCPMFKGGANRGQFSIAYTEIGFQQRPGFISTTPLAELLNLITLEDGGQYIDFLKMDIEGVEYKVFQEPRGRFLIMMQDWVRFLFLERHGPNTDYFDDSFFSDMGYDPKDPQKKLLESLAICGFSDVKENAIGQMMIYNSNFEIKGDSAQCLKTIAA
jgi:FkbM family methyltransferase